MGEYFETDEVAKGYDPKIFSRIMGYVKPYALLAAVALIALALSTAGELAIPVMVQRAMDDAILPGWRAVSLGAADSANAADAAALKALRVSDSDLRIGGWAYLPLSRFQSLSAARQKALEESGSLDSRTWHLFPTEGKGTGPALDELLARKPGVFLMGKGFAAILRSDLSSLPGAEARLIRHRDADWLVNMALVILLILALNLGATFLQTYITSLIGQKVMKDMRMELYGKTLRQSLAFISRHPVGRLVTRLTNDVETVNEFFTSVVAAFLKDLSVMAGVIVVIFFLNPRLAAVTILTLLPIAAATWLGRIKARDAFRRQRTWTSRVNAFLSEHLSGQSVVKLFNRQKPSEREFASRSDELLKAGFAEMYFFATFRPAVDLFASISTGVIIWAGARMFLGLSISLGTLIAFINLIRMFYSPVMDISEKYNLLQSAMAGGERVFALLDADEAIPDAGKAGLGEVRGSIDFRDVRFSYKKGEEVIRGLSFSVKPGEMVAIVGYTGAGKTTITNLIARLWDVDSGSILLDGVDLREIPLDELRRAVQPVLQEVFLFSGTIRENILLGAQFGEDKLRAAAAIVGADDFIMALPDGYDTRLAEGATNISAGQRQLVSFARVVAQDPRLIILDEATSNVDTETERMIQKGLSGLLAGRTSIVIAHRLSTIQHADRIMVLGHGRLLEEGSHQELLKKRGVYHELYRLQYEKESNG